MREPKIKISDQAYARLCTVAAVRKLTLNMGGFIDEVIFKIVGAMQAGEEELSLRLKEEGQS